MTVQPIKTLRGRPLHFHAGPAGQTDDPVELVQQIGEGFKDFRQTYDERVSNIEAALDEQSKQIGRLTVGGGGTSHARDSGDEASRFFATVSARSGRKVSGTAVDYSKYRDALDKYFRQGDGVSPDVRNEMQVGADPEGGYLVTPERSERMIRRIHEISPMRAIAGIETTTSDKMEFVTDPNLFDGGGWVAEQSSRPETDTGDIGLHTIEVHEQYAMPVVTQKLLDDADRDVVTYVNGKIEERFAKDEAGAFVTGDGVGKPTGLLKYGPGATTTDDDSRDWGILQRVDTGNSGAFPASDPADILFDLVAKLKPAYRANGRWLMNRSTENVVRKFKDGQGNYLWSMGNISQGQPNLLLGYPVTLAEDMPDIAANSFSIAFGDFEMGYTILDRIGVRVLRDPYTTKGKVKFYATKRVGGDVINFDALKLLKFAA